MASFPFPDKISQDSKRKLDQRHMSVSYGDGYQQRAAIGLHSIYNMWDIQLHNLTLAERNTMDAFFMAHGMVQSFDWTPPNGTAGKWVFSSPLEETNTALVYHFNFSLLQVFE
jgi:phage-related protein